MKTPEEIQELAIAKYGTGIYSIDEVDAYVVGYNQCQNDMAIQTMSNGKRRVAPFKQDSMNVVWENGYQMALLDIKDKQYNEDEVKEMALDFIINTGILPKTIEEWQNALWKFYEQITTKEDEK